MRGSREFHQFSCGLILLLAVALTGCSHLGGSASLRQECAGLVKYHEQGEHKGAVDGWDALSSEGYSCLDRVRDAVTASRQRLTAADALVRDALQLKRDGDLPSAADRLKSALDVYPRYYWVSKLLEGVESTIDAQVGSLVNEAGYLQHAGDLEGGLNRLREARMLRPDDEAVLAAMEKMDMALDHRQASDRAEKALTLARTLTAQGRLSEAAGLLEKSEAIRYLGQPAKEAAEVISQLHEARALDLYSRARALWKAGDLEGAVKVASSALAAGPKRDPLRQDTIELARLLGIKLYSSGSFAAARKLWLGALDADPGNTEIARYLAEADQRLADIERIREGTHR
jgi:tetratricopeptide (TPR) repeat protein